MPRKNPKKPPEADMQERAFGEPPEPVKRGPGRPRKHPRPEPPRPYVPVPRAPVSFAEPGGDGEDAPDGLEEFFHEEGGDGLDEAPLPPFMPPAGVVPSLDGGLTGISATERDQVFEVAPSRGVRVFNREAYDNLRRFIGGLPNKSDFNLVIFRQDHDEPDVNRRRKYCGRIPIPSGLLDEAIEAKWGGGDYFWQLGIQRQFASPRDLPPTLRGAALSGYICVDGPRKAFGPAESAGSSALAGMDAIREAAAASSSQMTELLKEQLRSARQEAGSSTQAIVGLMSVLLTGMQQQQQLAMQLGQQQTAFLMNIMNQQESRHREGAEDKERFLVTVLQAVGVGGGDGGEPKKPWEKVVDTALAHAPQVLDVLKMFLAKAPEVVLTPKDSPVPQLPPVRVPPPPAAPALPAAPDPLARPPASVEKVGAFDLAEDGEYISAIINVTVRAWEGKLPVEAACTEVADQGAERQYEALLATDAEVIVKLINNLWTMHRGGQAPAELLAYCRQVHAMLLEGPPEEPEGGEGESHAEPAPAPPEAVKTAPAIPEVATPPQAPAAG
jgi:hypothetical protein